MMVLEIVMFSVITVMMGKFGVSELAAHQIATQCANFVFTILLGISQATSMKVSYARGANHYEEINLVAYTGIWLGILSALAVAFIFILLSKPIIYLFVDGSNVLENSCGRRQDTTCLHVEE
jgi:MATE family multidrug resistance protein